MSEWRFLRGWNEGELTARLDLAKTLGRNFDDGEAGMTPERGWSRHHSSAIIAREAPGPAVDGGPFMRAWDLLARYAFSDPRIAHAHFNPSAPLEQRVMLIEVFIWGLRYLNPVIVSRVYESSDAAQSVKGFRYETLDGHFECGLEWFLLTKNHSTGEITFTVHAGWRDGDFPNWWSRLGFQLLALRYQRAWHRLAHLRLRQMLGSLDLAPLPRGRRLVTQGPPLPVFATIQEVASGAPPSPIITEQEQTPAAGTEKSS